VLTISGVLMMFGLLLGAACDDHFWGVVRCAERRRAVAYAASFIAAVGFMGVFLACVMDRK
jgi:hypothetical protein